MIKFTKMEGLGNDYIYIDCTNKSSQEIKNISCLAQKLSDRHFGIGSDGIILICKSNIADFKMLIFNSDGSEAQMCGNGIRCVGKFVYDKKMIKSDKITIETLAGIKEIILQKNRDELELITVNMGKPILEASKIPVISSENIAKNIKIKALDRDFSFTCVSMGNPHAVTIVDNLDEFDVEKYGKVLEKDNHFPERSNIEFIQILDSKTIKMRVWERGAGETLACGTGACAVCVACTLNKLIEKNVNIKIRLLGGDLDIKYNDTVLMTGPARTVFEGEYYEKGGADND